ncbi:MAG: TolB protein, partial [Solirubrobacterales bacterium]|nr:TolB protein [Solirubrobacterales bacterium]
GRFVAFWSDSSNLVGNDTNAAFDIFVRDLERKTTKLVSVGSAGGSADASSYLPSISADGRFVAFESIATNLVPNDTNALRDVFVRDLRERRTKRHSLSSAGIQANGDSRDAAISDDGRFVAFTSSATNLVGTDTNGNNDIFIRDRGTRTTRLISVSSTGVLANSGNYDPSVSADGRFVAFMSPASNLVGTDTNAQQDIFVRDRLQHTTKRVSVSSAGAEANGGSTGPSISDSGRLVAFYSGATNLVGNDTNNNDDIFVRGPA